MAARLRALKHTSWLNADHRRRIGLESVSVKDLAEKCSVPIVLKAVPRCASKQHCGQTGVLSRAFQVCFHLSCEQLSQRLPLQVEGHKLEVK